MNARKLIEGETPKRALSALKANTEATEARMLKFLQKAGFQRNRLSNRERWYKNKDGVHYCVKKLKNGAWVYDFYDAYMRGDEYEGTAESIFARLERGAAAFS